MKRPQDNPRRTLVKKKFARELRQQMTEHERKLWSDLRDKRFVDLRFRRQQPIGPYIVDFYCSAAKLIIELDGGQHTEPRHAVSDAARTKWLESRGYRVLRVPNFSNSRERNLVLDEIWQAVYATRPRLPASE